MDMKTKTELFTNVLKEAEFYEIFDVREDEGYTYFNAEQNMGNGRCQINIELSDRAFTPVTFCLGKLNNAGKKQKMIDLMNEFNSENVYLKFCLDEYDNIIVQFTYIDSDDQFNAKTLFLLLSSSFKSISDVYYGKFMRLMWS